MERTIKGILRGVDLNGVKAPLSNAHVCGAYFDGTPYDKTSSRFCSTTDKNGNFSVVVPDGWYSVGVTYQGYKPLVIDLNDWADFCQGANCQINLTMEASNEVMPEITVNKQLPSGETKKVFPLKKALPYIGASSLLLLGIVLYVKFKK